MKNIYRFAEADKTITPTLVYYRELIKKNTEIAIDIAGGANRLWPHVKTHKAAQMVRLQIDMGISRFKCATIAEAEMIADCGGENILIAYPLIGPNIERVIQLQRAYPQVKFWGIGDDFLQIAMLGKAFLKAKMTGNVLVDVDMGTHRTGVALDKVMDFYIRCQDIDGIHIDGLHCYDGNHTDKDYEKRCVAVNDTGEKILAIRKKLSARNISCDTLVMGGSPSFSCYKNFPQAYFSPGTLFIQDYGYSCKFPDLPFTPAAVILTRVISSPMPGHFTLDLGYKGIAADPIGQRGIIVGVEHAKELFQSEEHWAFCMEKGFEKQCPAIGDALYVIPTHICPTSALYPFVNVVEQGHIVAKWAITARNRKIMY